MRTLADALVSFSKRSNEEWIALCKRFLAWHRQNQITPATSPDELQAIEKVHTWLLRTARLMHAQMVDPNFSDREMASRVATILWHLEDAWSAAHNPMTEAEADALVEQFFPPNEPRA